MGTRTQSSSMLMVGLPIPDCVVLVPTAGAEPDGTVLSPVIHRFRF